jgi:phage terminase large subunit-like protein
MLIPPLRDPVRSDLDRAAVAAGCYFDYDAAYRVYEFMGRFLRHTVGEFAGQTFIPLEWQWQDVIGPLYGWKRKDGSRRYREAYISVAKKNGKSTLTAALALYALVADGEASAQVFSAAADRNQASIVYDEALKMVEESKGLSRILLPRPSRKEILYPQRHSSYRVLSSDAYRQEGLNIHTLIFDEFHAQPNSALYDALKYGGAARRQPLFIYITTAGYDRESVCWKKHLYAQDILSGISTDWESFAYIAEGRPGDMA